MQNGLKRNSVIPILLFDVNDERLAELTKSVSINSGAGGPDRTTAGEWRRHLFGARKVQEDTLSRCHEVSTATSCPYLPPPPPAVATRQEEEGIVPTMPRGLVVWGVRRVCVYN